MEVSTVEGAQALVQRLYAAEAQLTQEYFTLQAKSAEAQSGRGDKLLSAMLQNNDDPRVIYAMPVVKAGAEQQAQAAALLDAIEAARAKRATAIKAVYSLQAQSLAEQAQQMQAAAAKHKERADKLRSALEQHEGAEFVAASAAFIQHAQLSSAFSDTQALPGLPKSQLMQREAAQLEQQAQVLANKQVQNSGAYISGPGPHDSANSHYFDSLSSLLDNDAATLARCIAHFEMFDAMQIAPSVISVINFLQPFVDQVAAYRERSNSAADERIVIEIVYSEGQIDAQRSRAWITSA